MRRGWTAGEAPGGETDGSRSVTSSALAATGVNAATAAASAAASPIRRATRSVLSIRESMLIPLSLWFCSLSGNARHRCGARGVYDVNVDLRCKLNKPWLDARSLASGSCAPRSG
jgi:hypothetical protein